MLILKIVILLLLTLIGFQDLKSRSVFWFLFPLVGICMAILFLKTTSYPVYGLNVGVNLGIVGFVLGILYTYTKLKLKLNFWKEAFGLGDALFFIAFAVSFPMVSFLVLFVGALLFSLVIGFFFQKQSKNYTVPLAGYMSLFLIVVFVGAWVYSFNLYLI